MDKCVIAINLVANTFGQKFLDDGDEILITELEHHSNYIPWHFLRKSKGIKIEFADVNDDGEVFQQECIKGDEVYTIETAYELEKSNSTLSDFEVVCVDI